MSHSDEANCDPCVKPDFIPKYLYDVNKCFPPGVGKCSSKNGPNKDVSKETKDWLSKVTYKYARDRRKRVKSLGIFGYDLKWILYNGGKPLSKIVPFFVHDYKMSPMIDDYSQPLPCL